MKYKKYRGSIYWCNNCSADGMIFELISRVFSKIIYNYVMRLKLKIKHLILIV